MKKLFFIAALCTALAGLAAGCSQAPTPASRAKEKPDRLYAVKSLPPEERQRVLLLHSYHEEYIWLKNVNQGILQALAEERYLPGKNIEIDAFYMDTKRKTSAEWKVKVARKAIEKIKAWNPHVVIASDDNAQSHVVSKMAGSETPFVFLGVNADPMTYGYISSMEMPGGNITGCIERERFELSVNLLRQMVPEVSKIAVICDDGPTGKPVLERVRENAAAAGVSIVASARIANFREWKRFVMDVQAKADALLVAVYHAPTDDDGNHADVDAVLNWTVSNSRLPDNGFWKWSVEGGLLCSEAISGCQQGHDAGTAASYVLAGQSPGEFAVQMPRRSEICIKNVRAESLGLSIPAELMKSATLFDVIQSAG